jgi:hypothetical protein
MKFLSLLTAFLFAAAAIFAAPVPENVDLEARGDGVVYDVTTKIIIVTVYIVTETEFLYEVKCDYDKWKKTCDHKVHLNYLWSGLTFRHSTKH